VLAAVTDLLREVGYQSLTMEAVAARAGVGKTTVYRWWPTKPALVIDAVADALPPVEVELSGETRRDVRAVVARLAHTDTAAAMADVLPALAAEARRDPDAAERLSALLGPRRAADAAVLLTAAARRDLPHDVDVTLLLDAALGALLLRRLRGEEPTDAVVDALTDLLTHPR
jgi:AcrR family transcriptional regulator